MGKVPAFKSVVLVPISNKAVVEKRPDFPYYHDMLLELIQNKQKMTRSARKRALKIKKSIKAGNLKMEYAAPDQMMDPEIEEIYSKKKSQTPNSSITPPSGVSTVPTPASGMKTPESDPASTASAAVPEKKEDDTATGTATATATGKSSLSKHSTPKEPAKEVKKETTKEVTKDAPKPSDLLKGLATVKALAKPPVAPHPVAPKIPQPIKPQPKPEVKKKKKQSGDSLGSLSSLTSSSEDEYSAGAKKKKDDTLKLYGKSAKQIRREAKIREYYQNKCMEAKEIYPNCEDVPDISDSTPVHLAKKLWLTFYNKQKLRGRLENNGSYLEFGASGLEFAADYFGFDAEGFASEQASSRSVYNPYLAKIGKSSFASFTKNWPDELKALGLLVWRFAMYLIGKKMGFVKGRSEEEERQDPEFDYSEGLAKSGTQNKTVLKGPSWRSS